MQWLTDLLKFLTVTRPLAGALFITSSTMLFGPRVAPNFFKPIPSQWDWLAVAILVFTAAIQAIWYFPSLFRVLGNGIKFFIHNPRISKLSKEELRMLRYMAAHGDRPINLEAIAKEPGSVTKIDLLVVSQKLQVRGLVEERNYDSDFISLTKRGISLCHKLKGQAQDA